MVHSPLIARSWTLRIALKRLTCVALSALAHSGPVAAAEIRHEKLTETQAAITIDGEIVPADVERFRQLALRSPEAVVVLNSSGGAVLPAIEIGRTLRIAGFSTTVPREAVCASACALIWLAGTPRLLIGRVGFHAAYKDNTGKAQESGAGNALVGNYLTLLGLSARAVLFATSAPPDRILWLTNANKEVAGIDFSLPPPPIQTVPVQPPRIQTQQTAATLPPRYAVTILDSKPAPMKDDPTFTFYTFRYLGFTLKRFVSSEGSPEDHLEEFIDEQIEENDGWLLFSSSGQQGSRVFWWLKPDSINRTSSEVGVWVKQDHQYNKTKPFRTALSYLRVFCKAGNILEEDYTEYSKEGRDVTSSNTYSNRLHRIIPGSIDDELKETVC